MAVSIFDSAVLAQLAARFCPKLRLNDDSTIPISIHGLLHASSKAVLYEGDTETLNFSFDGVSPKVRAGKILDVLESLNLIVADDQAQPPPRDQSNYTLCFKLSPNDGDDGLGDKVVVNAAGWTNGFSAEFVDLKYRFKFLLRDKMVEFSICIRIFKTYDDGEDTDNGDFSPVGYSFGSQPFQPWKNCCNRSNNRLCISLDASSETTTLKASLLAAEAEKDVPLPGEVPSRRGFYLPQAVLLMHRPLTKYKGRFFRHLPLYATIQDSSRGPFVFDEGRILFFRGRIRVCVASSENATQVDSSPQQRYAVASPHQDVVVQFPFPSVESATADVDPPAVGDFGIMTTTGASRRLAWVDQDEGQDNAQDDDQDDQNDGGKVAYFCCCLWMLLFTVAGVFAYIHKDFVV